MNTIPLIGLDTDDVKWRKAPTRDVRDFDNPARFEVHNALSDPKIAKGDYYGIVTGEANGIIVIDYDVCKEGENKGKVVDVDGKVHDLSSLLETYGEDAYVVQTGRGGFHVYCKQTEEVADWRNTTRVKGCIDVRANGGYVVGAGSPGYKVVNGDLANLTAVPQSVIDLVGSKVKAKRKPSTRNKASFSVDEVNEVAKLIEEHSPLTGVTFAWKHTAPYNFTCDQIGQLCPLCSTEDNPNIHENNNYYYWTTDDGQFWIKNHSERCKAKCLDHYSVVKHVFEKRVCRINDSLNYPSDDGHSITMYKKELLKERYIEWECTGLPEGMDFITRWLRDKSKKQYRTMDFYPEGCPDDVYNLWRGFDVENIDPELGKKGNIEPFIELTNIVTGNEPSAREYVLNYFTMLFQKPNTKPKTALVLKGLQGTGKTTYLDVIRHMMGEDLCYDTADAASTVFGAFADAYDRKKLVIMNESQSTVNFKNQNKLKALVTDETGLSINKKHQHAYLVRNIAGTIFCTNDSVPVNVTTDDRRMVIFNTATDRRNDEEYFRNYVDWATKPENQRALYDFFMSRDVSNFNWVADRPKTKAYMEVTQKCLAPIIKFLEYFTIHDYTKQPEVIKGSGIHEFKSSTMKSSFQQFLPPGERLSDAMFGSKVKKMKEEHNLKDEALKVIHKSQGKYWVMNRQLVYEWLKENNFTSYEGELPEAVDHHLPNSYEF